MFAFEVKTGQRVSSEELSLFYSYFTMIHCERHRLDNGLTVIINREATTPLVAVNLLYKTGSGSEDPHMTGMAHLFEHMMFSGTTTEPNFDRRVDLAGGQNNAFTNCDVTNYYITLPANNLETALWLESDRMQNLVLTEENLSVQKSVVTEEFKQRYLNQPYGDRFLLLRDLLYGAFHPYGWPPIGKSSSHIESITKEAASAFYKREYSPDNAILVISGNIEVSSAIKLTERWFGSIENSGERKGCSPVKALPGAVAAGGPARKVVERNVPADSIYKAWEVPGRSEDGFHTFDMITDILAGGESGRLYRRLVRDKHLLSSVNAFVSGEIDSSMLVVTGMVAKDISADEAEEAIEREIELLSAELVDEKECQKVKNRFRPTFHMSLTGITNRSALLAMHEAAGSADEISDEIVKYTSVTPSMMMTAARSYLTGQRCATLRYKRL